MVKVQIYYSENRPAVYLPGDVVSGTVVVQSDSVITTRSIYIGFTGVESVTLEETSYAAVPTGNGVTVLPVTSSTTNTNTFFSTGKVRIPRRSYEYVRD